MKNTKYLKTNIMGFVISCIIVGGFAVYAAVTFPSKDVTYENGTSGLESTDVQGAIDELYTECTKEPTAGDSILENTDVVTSGDGLYKDENEDRYFYKGKNVKNYVTFNNETAGWRIISVEKDGTIKIIRNTSIGDMSWNSNKNNWDKPASLNTYLNGKYYNSLTSIAKSQIVSKDFSIGAVVYNDTNLSNIINSENATKWNGKIALATASEYIRSNSNQESCGNMNQVWHSTSCGNTTWMHNSTNWWTLSASSGSASSVLKVYSTSNFGNGKIVDSGSIRPVLYLSADVQITGGDGSKSNPFTLG